LRQRVTVRYHLRALDQGETAAYINHRLRKAAIGAPLVFSKEVTDLIAQASEGLPRKINVIADAALLFGYGEDKHVVDASLVHEVITELAASGVLVVPKPAKTEAAPPAAEADFTRVDAAALEAARAAAEAAAETERRLAAREAAIANRQRELAEQRRVLTEQYRLLRQSPAAAAPVQAPVAWPPRRPVVTSPQPPRRTAPAPIAPTMFASQTPPPQPGFWARVRRSVFGVSKPIFEE